MSESTLSLSYPELMATVGEYLGYGNDSANWSTGETAEIDRYVQSGVRQFYYPPRTEGVEEGFEWSFLSPTTTLVTADGVSEVDLPDDLGRVIGNFYFEDGDYCQPVIQVSESVVIASRQRDTVDSQPLLACVRYKATDATDGQRMEASFYPTPDGIYTLSYKYEAYNGKLDATYPYPLGGMRFAELITESCLAIAEQRANDEKGIHWDQFTRLLATGVAMDRRQGARYYGQMGDGGEVPKKFERTRSGDVTYKSETW